MQWTRAQIAEIACRKGIFVVTLRKKGRKSYLGRALRLENHRSDILFLKIKQIIWAAHSAYATFTSSFAGCNPISTKSCPVEPPLSQSPLSVVRFQRSSAIFTSRNRHPSSNRYYWGSSYGQSKRCKAIWAEFALSSITLSSSIRNWIWLDSPVRPTVFPSDSRLHLFHLPRKQALFLELCFWQAKPIRVWLSGNNFALSSLWVSISREESSHIRMHFNRFPWLIRP